MGRKTHQEVWEGSGGPTEEPGGVGRARRGREALQKGMGGVGRPSWRAGMGWEAFLKGTRRVGRLSRRGRKGGKAQQKGGRGQETLPSGQVGF